MKSALELKNVSFSRKRDFEMKNVSASIPEGKSLRLSVQTARENRLCCV